MRPSRRRSARGPSMAGPRTARRRRAACSVAAAAALVLAGAGPAAGGRRLTAIVSVSASGQGGNLDNAAPAVSADGRFVAFYSVANDLVPNDTNQCFDYYDGTCPDAFVKDLVTGAIARVSVASDGAQANGPSGNVGECGNREEQDQPGTCLPPAISADGRYIAFESQASNLVPGDTNNFCDDDFDGNANDNCSDIFLHDRDADGNGVFDEPGGIATTRLSVSSTGTQGNGPSNYPTISFTGELIAFQSAASNLVPGDTNGKIDVLVRHVPTSSTKWISAPARIGSVGDSTLPAISADGTAIAFSSEASNLGPADGNDFRDVYRKDLQTGAVAIASLSSISNEFGNGPTGTDRPAISANGRYVAFSSSADNLVPADMNGVVDMFRRDLQGGLTELVSLDTEARQALAPSFRPAISADGRFVTFDSIDAFEAQDQNDLFDVYMRDVLHGITARLSEAVGRDGPSLRAVMSADGSVVVFDSAAQLVPQDDDWSLDVYAVNRVTCADGRTEDGPVSGRLHEQVEPRIDPGPLSPARPTVHTASCAIAQVDGS